MQLSDLIKLLYQHSGFETVEANQPAAGTVRLLGRVRNDRVSDWILTVHQLLTHEGNGWNVDISKYHFLRAGKTIYAWRVLIQAQDMAAQIPRIYAVVQKAPRSSRMETNEMPLIGASRNRNVMVRGRGAGPTGSVAVGPALLRSLG